MRFFKKKDRIIDLSEHYKKQQAKAEEIKQDLQESSESLNNSGGALSFLGGLAGGNSQNTLQESSNSGEVSGEIEDKRKRLAKRLRDMTEKIEELSNQIYHIQQRLEVVEKKIGVNRF
jgi:methyl-accepting chemotaxis protein